MSISFFWDDEPCPQKHNPELHTAKTPNLAQILLMGMFSERRL
jgi:hypothetical protein